jgi:hypothetical protein
VSFYDHPGEAPTPRAVIDRDRDCPALGLKVVAQGTRLRRGHVPGEHHDARAGSESGGLAGRSGGVELGVSIREYRELEAGTAWPTSEVWHRICDLFGWPQTFVGGRRNA